MTSQESRQGRIDPLPRVVLTVCALCGHHSPHSWYVSLTECMDGLHAMKDGKPAVGIATYDLVQQEPPR